MSISSTTRKAGPFVGNDVQTIFPFTFKVFSSADLVPVRANTIEEVYLELGVDFTASLNGDQDAAPGGTITLAVPLAGNERLVILSGVAALQQVVVTNGGGFFPAVFNGVFDRLTILIQQALVDQQRAMGVALTDDDVSLILPIAAARAGGTLAFDDDGVPIVGPGPGDLTAAIATATTKASEASASAASAAAALAQTLTAFDQFDDRYLGAKTADPTLDNDGNALVAGALYYNTVLPGMKVYTGSAWVVAYVSGGSYALTSTTVTGSGLVTGGGDLSANRVLAVAAALAADILAATSTSKAVTPDALADAREPAAQTVSGAVSLSLANTCIHHLTLNGNITLAALTSIGRAGQDFVIKLKQDGTGSRTLTINTAFKFPGGVAPTLSTAAGAIDEISGYVDNAGTPVFSCRFAKGVA